MFCVNFEITSTGFNDDEEDDYEDDDDDDNANALPGFLLDSRPLPPRKSDVTASKASAQQHFCRILPGHPFVLPWNVLNSVAFFISRPTYTV